MDDAQLEIGYMPKGSSAFTANIVAKCSFSQRSFSWTVPPALPPGQYWVAARVLHPKTGRAVLAKGGAVIEMCGPPEGGACFTVSRMWRACMATPVAAAVSRVAAQVFCLLPNQPLRVLCALLEDGSQQVRLEAAQQITALPAAAITPTTTAATMESLQGVGHAVPLKGSAIEGEDVLSTAQAFPPEQAGAIEKAWAGQLRAAPLSCNPHTCGWSAPPHVWGLRARAAAGPGGRLAHHSRS